MKVFFACHSSQLPEQKEGLSSRDWASCKLNPTMVRLSLGYLIILRFKLLLAGEYIRRFVENQVRIVELSKYEAEVSSLRMAVAHVLVSFIL